MDLVVVESPYAGDVEANVAYARAALADCLRRGEAPFASHLLYTQPGVLDDADPVQRRLGMDAGFVWGAVAARTVVYADLGVSAGMVEGVERARRLGRPVVTRYLWEADADQGVLDSGRAGESPSSTGPVSW